MSREHGSTQSWSIRDIESLINEYPEYARYMEQKKEIKAKYPEELFILRKRIDKRALTYTPELRELHKQYLKEISDLIFKPEGDFQQFTWESLSDVEKLLQERKARGRKRGLIDY